jgi:hypothetical protein
MNSDNFIILAIVLVSALIAIVVSVYQTRRRKEILTQQAEKRNGELAKSGFLGRWELRLPYKGNTLVIYSVPGSKYSPPKTFAILKDDSARLPTISIGRSGLGQKIMDKFGKERLLTNDEEFDRQFVVRSEDPFIAQRMLTAELRPKLIERSGMRSLHIKITPQEMRVTTFSIPSNEDDYDNFIDTAFLILKNIL